ncbi:PREDICTED: sterol O-acyltransferase 1-like isoform X2 [Priapulus caudatus]|nr:PREDICTED: sterol O-acyltransferase 1-like isoform X2 [Priapulus caudatus]XP_014678016.1 PREDICTED: sterol O-acyltransferase 1-like isoform X2 [Priapulus caudatus]
MTAVTAYCPRNPWSWREPGKNGISLETILTRDISCKTCSSHMKASDIFSQVNEPAPQNIFKEMKLEKIRERTQKLREDVLEQVNSQVNDKFEDYLAEVEHIESDVFQKNGDTTTHFSQKKTPGELPDKVFVTRESLLTELLEVSHVRSIYHVFVAILILFTLNTLIQDYLDTGRLVLDFSLILWAMGKIPQVMFVWAVMMLSTMAIVFCTLQFWAGSRTPLKTWQASDYFWLAIYIVYMCLFLYFPMRWVLIYQLPPASTTIIVAEQTRLIMKTHSFVRETITRVVNFKAKDDEETDQQFPDFSCYLYFLFAPTLVYRDHYPRTSKVRWNHVATNFAEVVASLIYVSFIFTRFCMPVFRNFNADHVNIQNYILASFGCVLPGTLVLFIAFFAILHSWLNAFAEMLRFGDRMFYKDWWNSTSFSAYYRTWNVVVHDWLYTYVYRDVYHIVGDSHRTLAMMFVFVLSAVFHEYILTMAMGFFYPVLFFMFAGAGFSFTLPH